MPSDFWDETATKRAAHCTCWAWAGAAISTTPVTDPIASAQFIRYLFIELIAKKSDEGSKPGKVKLITPGIEEMSLY